MSSPTVRTDRGLSAETRAVVEAVLDAIDIPHAATVTGDQTRAAIMTDRATTVMVNLQSLLRDGDGGRADVDLSLRILRDQIAKRPAAGYVTANEARRRREAGMGYFESVAEDLQDDAEVTA